MNGRDHEDSACAALFERPVNMLQIVQMEALTTIPYFNGLVGFESNAMSTTKDETMAMKPSCSEEVRNGRDLPTTVNATSDSRQRKKKKIAAPTKAEPCFDANTPALHRLPAHSAHPTRIPASAYATVLPNGCVFQTNFVSYASEDQELLGKKRKAESTGLIHHPEITELEPCVEASGSFSSISSSGGGGSSSLWPVCV